MPEARSCYVGNFYLGDWPSPRPITHTPKINVPIQKYCKTVSNVVYSSEEAETCVDLNNNKTAICMRTDLISLEHKQQATPLKTDNSTTSGFVKSGMNQKFQKHGI